MKNKKFLLLLPAIVLAGCGTKGNDPLTKLDEWITGHFKQDGQEQFREDQGITDESSDTEIEIKIDEETEEVEIVETDISVQINFSQLLQEASIHSKVNLKETFSLMLETMMKLKSH